MLRILFFLYFWLIAAPVFIIATILTALTVIAGCMLGGEKFFSFYPGMLWSKLTCYLALSPVEVRGRDHIKKNQSYVFVSNHQGAFDIFLIYGFLGVPVKWMMKVGLGRIPLVGAACRAAGFIFVDHSTPATAKRSIAETKRKLANGASLVAFPEGSRSPNGKIRRFHKGAFQIALDQRLPIVPITLNGPYNVMPAGTLNLYPHRMVMVIHPPIFVDEITYSGMKDLQQIANDVKELITSALWEEFK
ncbi:MAG: 1-acyl-sn-glycerol-3-phosphate acyltransferase [Tannerella sp.]|nr:1-acyl-sn-glycerol-3-phosphate acyltransferase [Tannerella sp.]